MSLDGTLVLCLWVSLLQINQYNFQPETFLRYSNKNNPLDGNQKDAIFDEMVNKYVDYKNFVHSVGIVTEQDIKDNQDSILIIPVGDHKEGFKYLVYCQRLICFFYKTQLEI